MANATPASIGRANAGGSEDALFLKVFAGEVLTSRTVVEAVTGSGLDFDDRGLHELKGVPGEWEVLAAIQ